MESQLIRTALKERIDHLTKLILNNSSFSSSPANALTRKTLAEPSDVDQVSYILYSILNDPCRFVV
jgi:hypothetical protein